jgi:TrmH family RNA methyltransferase
MNFDDLKRLRHRKHREELRHFLAEGEHLVIELGKAVARRPELAAARILATHEYLAAGLPDAFPVDLPIEPVSGRQMDQLRETRSPQGVVAVVPMLAPLPPSATERVIYLHQAQDPGNLGTILRTLAWFGGFRCLLSPDSVDPYNAKAVRASMGAIFNVPFETEVPFVALQERYPRIALLDTRGTPIADEAFANFDCHVFGSESQGAPAQVAATLKNSTFCIPGGHGVESLNLASTVNICAYELAVRSGSSRSQKPSSERR